MSVIATSLQLAIWLGLLVVASFMLSRSSEEMAGRFGARFVARTLLSVATTLPEIAVVGRAASLGLYGTALGSALGSNVLMMSLGLALMVFIATTKLSLRPAKWVAVEGFRLDAIFLMATAISSAFLFLDGYQLVDGLIFISFFAAYTLFAFFETKDPRRHDILRGAQTDTNHSKRSEEAGPRLFGSVRSYLLFMFGGAGVFWAAEPFVQTIEDLATELAVPAAIMGALVSPVAGEMPEKLSVILLARRGRMGVDMAIANVLGSKILNNSLLLGVMILAAAYSYGPTAQIPSGALLSFQVYWTAVLTFLALLFVVDKKLTRKEATLLALLYVVTMAFQFYVPRLII